RQFVREPASGEERALILDFDDLIGSDTAVMHVNGVAIDPTRRQTLMRHRDDGWRLFVHVWRPQVARKETTLAEVDDCSTRLRELLGEDIDIACCPHDAGPPVCWCRKPIPGSVLEFVSRRGISLARSIV